MSDARRTRFVGVALLAFSTLLSAPASAQIDAERILFELSRIAAAGGDFRDVSKAVVAKIQRRSGRIETACLNMGFALPEENREARTA